MISLENPLLLSLIFIPFIVYMFTPAYMRASSALKINFFQRVVDAGESEQGFGVRKVSLSFFHKFLLFLITALVVLAMAKPIYIADAKPKEEPMRDLLIAIDLSGSMATQDFVSKDKKPLDRLQAVKEVLHQFLQKRKGERIGLIFFGSAAFVQAPFTNELDAIAYFLDEAQVGMAGEQTMLGDAIGLSLKLFKESKIEDKMLILISDGDDTGSAIPPLQAAKLAKEHDVKIFTIGVGDSKNAGEHPLDVETLKKISSQTGGEFYYALDREGLSDIYTSIDKLQPKLVSVKTARESKELFIYPLALAFTLMFLYSYIILFTKRAI
jgi:Ca-activated chloride channel family protein